MKIQTKSYTCTNNFFNHTIIYRYNFKIITSSAKIGSLLFRFANLKAQNCISVIEMPLVNEK